ncbi:MAG: histidine phosphatase family protein [Muribaculaceae bacterium]|nr:histidine phosphatase family protein [Muribaculaceae bacterium]MDE6321919.1 histidine phosphatase family protein [Muribaculaceae bacterium]
MRIITLIATAMVAITLTARTALEEINDDLSKAGGVYYPYPVSSSLNTTPPAGYRPFYISHYGRHGSRYLISDNDYLKVIKVLSDARSNGALTPLGIEVADLVDSVWIETEGRGGDLSPLGVRQHKGIAQRMYASFPEVFEGDPTMNARSTIVMRCALSMDAFCEGLKELKPSLSIPREASNRWMNYLNYHSPQSNAFTSGEWEKQYKEFEADHTQPQRLMSSLFNDPEYMKQNVDAHQLMWGLYWLAADAPNTEGKIDFTYIFTPDELYDLWQCFNYRFYVCDSNYAGNHHMLLDNAKPLLRNILTTADEYIADADHGATLRFGHDGNLIPLAGLLQLDDCYNSVMNPAEFADAFRTYNISPMAANVQLVFFRNDQGDVLVKFMLNERETYIPVATDQWPFYKWNEVRAFYQSVLDTPDYLPEK